MVIDSVKRTSVSAVSIFEKDQATWSVLNDADEIKKQQDLLYKQHQQELEGEPSIWDRLVASQIEQ